jgi:subtilisin family serine protease
MKNKIFLLITLLLGCCAPIIQAQTIDPDAEDGRLFVRISDGSSAVFNDYNGVGLPSSADLVPFVAAYGLNKVYKPFAQFNEPRYQKIYTFEFTNIALVNNFITAIQGLSYVQYAEKVGLLTTSLVPNDPYFNNNNYHPQNWHLQKINAASAWNLNIGSTNTVIAVLDNEIDWQHPDLAPNLFQNTVELANGNDGIDNDLNGAIDDFYGWDAADNDNDPSGTYILDHGTHCAGIASGATNNSTGVSSIGYNCRIMPVKICSSSVTFNGPISMTAAIAGVIYARRTGADVISCSWGGPTQNATLSSEIALAIANNIVVVAAAGNTNSNIANYPAATTGVISVAATNPNDERASFSTYNSTVDISAPGTNIFSTNSRLIPNTPDGYSYKSGTSMACPLVAGLCGLILTQNPSFTPAQVLSCLQTTSTNINSIPANIPYAGLIGSGRINAPQAVLCASAPNTINSFFTADRTNACMNQTINLSGLSNATGITSWTWSFSPAPTTITPNNTSQNVSVTFANAAQVSVTLTVMVGSTPYTYTQNNYLNIGGPTANVVSATPYSICNGSPQSLIIGFQNGVPPFTYNISNGYTNETFTTTTPTDYFYFKADPNYPNYIISSITDGAGCTSLNNSNVNLTIVPCCQSIIANGDFEQGNALFASDNVIQCSIPNGTDSEGAASIVDQNFNVLPNTNISCWVGVNIPSSPDIRNGVFAVNGRKGANENNGINLSPLGFSTPAYNPGFTSRLWYQTGVNITPSSLYNIDFHTIGSYGCSNSLFPFPMVLRFEIIDINNQAILSSGDFVAPAPNGEWHQFSYVWNSLANSGTVEVRISQVSYFSSAYYDIAFDDISMRKVNIPVGNGGAFAGQDITICAGESVQLSGSGGPTYSWAPISSTIAQPTVAPLTTTTYTLTTNNSCGASSDPVTVYVVPYSCTSPSNIGTATTFNTATTNFGYNSVSTLSTSANITYAAGSHIINCDDVRMGPNVKITVKNGATLTITDAWLHGCASCKSMWEGIDVECGGTLIINNNSIIEDAKNAVKTITPSGTLIPNLQISNAIFNKNERAIYLQHIAVSAQDLTPVAANVINNCIFTCRSITTTPNATNFNNIKNSLYNNTNAYPTLTTFSGARSKAGVWIDMGLTHANGYEIGTAGVNTGTGSGPINVFDNLDYGVHSTIDANLMIRNNLFINLTGNSVTGNSNANPYPQPFGVGISGYGDKQYIGIGGDAAGATANGGNIFKNCNRGISLYGYQLVYMRGNTIDNNITSPINSFQTAGYYTGQYGAYLSPKGSQITSSLQIIGNNISNTAYAIHINRTNAYSGNNYRIECNTITAAGTPSKYLKKGIYLQDAVGSTTGMPQYGINVRFNTISFAEEQVILADNIKVGLDISCNNELSVKYVAGPNAFPNTIDVIRLNNCQGVKVEANSLLKTSGGNTLKANLGITGIYINNSSASGNNNIINNNDINYVGSCVVWAGNNPTGTQFKGNKMQNSNTGLYMYTNAAFNTQGGLNVPMGNRWGTTGSGSLISHTTTNSGTNINNFAKIYVKSPSGTGTQTGVAITHNLISGTAYTTGVPTTNGIIETGGTEPTFIGCVASPCGGGGGGGGGAMGIILNDNGQNNTLSEIGLFDLKRLAFDNTTSGFYNTERQWYNKSAVMKILIDANKTIENNDLYNFYQDIDNASIKSFGLVEYYLEQNNVEMAEKELHSIVPNNIIEQNLYEINQTIIDYNLGLIDIANNAVILNRIFEIGNMCSFSSGPAVYKARSLYNGLVKGGYSFIENCQDQIATEGVTENNVLHSAYFNLYPNPNDGRMTIEYDLEENVNAQLEVYDINGRIIWKKYVDPTIHTARIEMNGLADGIYLYKLVVDGQILESNRFIIIK